MLVVGYSDSGLWWLCTLYLVSGGTCCVLRVWLLGLVFSFCWIVVWVLCLARGYSVSALTMCSV